MDPVEDLRQKVKSDIASYEASVGKPLAQDVQSNVRLSRFLDAFDLDVEKAKAAYLEMLEWRAKEKVEELREQKIASMDILRQSSLPHAELVRSVGEYGPWMSAGESFDGDLIQIEVLARVDPSMLLETVNVERIMEHQIGFFEVRGRHLDQLSEQKGRMVRTIQIRDVSNFGMNILTHTKANKLISAIMKAGSRNYPESTKKAIFVDVPSSFYTLWGLVSTVLREKTVKKVKFLPAEFHRPLLEIVPARAIHRLEKMRTSQNHEFVDNDLDDDEFPLEQKNSLVVPARAKTYQSYWLTRTGQRQKVKIVVESDLKPTEISFVSSKPHEGGEEGGQLLEINLNRTENNEYCFPQDLDLACESGFLLLTFSNEDSWIQSVTVPLTATFSAA